MFRLLRLKPPHGWNAVAWELAIVTLGVLIALAAQQWAEGRIWQDKAKASKSALLDELALHYSFAVEFRVVYPCLQGQLDALRKRVLSSGATLQPAPVFHEPRSDYVFRLPGKFYPSDVWEEAISDGVVRHLDPAVRSQFAGHYAALESIRDLNSANTESEEALMTLAHPLPLDPSTRYSMAREIELLSGRLEYLDLLNGQLIDFVQQLGMIPPAEDARKVTQRYGTYPFCQAQGLPLRSFEDAMQAVPN